jgi:hypothetical protein
VVVKWSTDVDFGADEVGVLARAGKRKRKSIRRYTVLGRDMSI